MNPEIEITTNNDDVLVTVSMTVAVPKDVLAENNPAKATMSVVKANISSRLDSSGVSAMQAHIDGSGNIVEDVKNRIMDSRKAMDALQPALKNE